MASSSGGCRVVTAHSLEPMRPWKAEQLGGGYRVSSFVERTAFEAADAVIAVSAGMREDVLRSYPSVDLARSTSCTTASTPSCGSGTGTPTRCGDTVSTTAPPSSSSGASPGEGAALPAARRCRAAAGRPARPVRGRTRHPEILAEVEGLMDDLRAQRDGVVWIPEMLPAAR